MARGLATRGVGCPMRGRLGDAALMGIILAQVALAAMPGLLACTGKPRPRGGKPPADAAAADTAPAADTPAPAHARPAYQVADRSEAAMAASAAPSWVPAKRASTP